MTVLDNTLVKHTFLELLKQEFDIHIDEWETEKIMLAKESIEIYDSMEAFYKATNWQMDNPEESGEEYLLKHRVLAEIQGKLWYFSRLKYEDGLKKTEK